MPEESLAKPWIAWNELEIQQYLQRKKNNVEICSYPLHERSKKEIQPSIAFLLTQEGDTSVSPSYHLPLPPIAPENEKTGR